MMHICLLIYLLINRNACCNETGIFSLPLHTIINIHVYAAYKCKVDTTSANYVLCRDIYQFYQHVLGEIKSSHDH